MLAKTTIPTVSERSPTFIPASAIRGNSGALWNAPITYTTLAAPSTSYSVNALMSNTA